MQNFSAINEYSAKDVLIVFKASIFSIPVFRDFSSTDFTAELYPPCFLHYIFTFLNYLQFHYI